jgi:ribonuclease Z
MPPPETPRRGPEPLREGHPFRQWKTWTIPGTRLTVTGYSRSNDKTFFHLPELRCCIDGGLCEGRRVDTVFLTHTHHDHAADLEYLAGKETGVDVYAPAAAVGSIEAYVRAKRELNHVAPYEPALAAPCRLHGVRAGDAIEFGRQGQYRARVAPCVHKVPCVGYAFSEVRRRLTPGLEQLKAEMVGQGKGAEFGRRMAGLRKAGEQVEEQYEVPLFAVMGNTHASVFDQALWLFGYPVIFTECTFLHDGERERADRAGHTVWAALRPVVEAHPGTLFVLTHFSLRHSDREVVAFFVQARASLPADNVVAWAHPESHLPEQHQGRDEG